MRAAAPLRRARAPYNIRRDRSTSVSQEVPFHARVLASRFARPDDSRLFLAGRGRVHRDAAPVAWHDSFTTRLEALALLQSLNADLLSHDSATLTLDRWCASHHLSNPPTITAERVHDVDKPATAAQRELLQVGATEPLGYRRVRLHCGAHVLSEADNWYVPSRLTAQMNQALEHSDIAFGRAVQALQFQRRTLSATCCGPRCREGWEMSMPRTLQTFSQADHSSLRTAAHGGADPAQWDAHQRTDRNLYLGSSGLCRADTS